MVRNTRHRYVAKRALDPREEGIEGISLDFDDFLTYNLGLSREEIVKDDNLHVQINIYRSKSLEMEVLRSLDVHPFAPEYHEMYVILTQGSRKRVDEVVHGIGRFFARIGNAGVWIDNKYNYSPVYQKHRSKQK